ncbi:MAG: Fic family protein, partial [Buchananella hordeovulneris]|nr:Fic family protein [Buchananella hordeovulneris]
YHPLEADFVPPPPEEVEGLIEDLLGYLNGAIHAPLLQAALVHAQFETIHPFAGGNGRVGRALIHTVLTRRGLTTGAVLPLSLVLATLSDEYVAALSAFRFVDQDGAGQEPRPADGLARWLEFFLTATLTACEQAERIGQELADVRASWEEDLAAWSTASGRGRALRADSAAYRILGSLPGTPVLTVASVQDAHGISRPAAQGGLETLCEAGILSSQSIGPGRRAYVAQAVLDTIAWAEHRLASTRFDTRASTPGRPAPARPRSAEGAK